MVSNITNSEIITISNCQTKQHFCPKGSISSSPPSTQGRLHLCWVTKIFIRLSKNKNAICFSTSTLLNNTIIIFFVFCYISYNFPLLNILSFSEKKKTNTPKCLLMSSGEMNFRISGNQNLQDLKSQKTSHTSCNNFDMVTKHRHFDIILMEHSAINMKYYREPFVDCCSQLF